MRTINVKVSGEKTEVKLLKKFQVSNFNLAVVEFSTGMKIGFSRSHKNTIKDIVEK